MIISCIGDSLTQGDYGVYGKSGIANVKEKNYPYFLKELTGAEVRNFGYCGFRSLEILNLINDNVINVNGSDVVIILLGTNGGMSGDEHTECNDAYDKIITYCKKNTHEAHIFLCTPPHVTNDPTKSNYGYFSRIKGAYEYIIKNYKEEENIHIIDLFNDDTFNENNEDIMQPNDGLHFGEVGYRTLANIIYNRIKNYFWEVALWNFTDALFVAKSLPW